MDIDHGSRTSVVSHLVQDRLVKSKSKSFFYARFFSQLPFSSTHVDSGEDDTVFEEAQVLFEKKEKDYGEQH